jgi:hypothetical protein
MIRWFIVVFLALMLISWFSPALQKLGFGRLPGDLRFKLFGREIFIPLTTTILLSLLCSADRQVRMKACIDIGGTKVAVSLNTAGPRPARAPQRTHRQDRQQRRARAQVMRMVDEACAEAGIAPAVQRAGVSSCRPVRAARGRSNWPRPTSAAASPGPSAACRTTG